jgi:poly-gamma-glutamate capsule biosynthesis protein CapA/YwtB (metallophosphatase superfamily)
VFNGIYRDQYDNVFRTGKIEPPTGKMKNRRFGTYKVHNIYDKDWKTRIIKTQKKADKGADLVIVK